MPRHPNQRKTKKAKKEFFEACLFCDKPGYKLLDAHRIVPPAEGGKYHWDNIIVACAGCHREVTVGEIVVKGRFLCTGGYYVVIYTKGGQEFVKPEVQIER